MRPDTNLINTTWITRVICAGIIAIWLLGGASVYGETADQNAPDAKATKPDEVIQLEQLVVTGDYADVEVKDMPADITVIDSERLDRPGTRNFRDALSDVPGVRLNGRQDQGMFGGGIELRGFNTNTTSGANVLMLLDGIPQRRLSFGGPYNGALPNSAITRMELLKGPSSSLYGRYALAGALQMFTEPGTQKLKIHNETLFESEVDAASTALTVSGPFSDWATFSVTASGGVQDGWQPRTEGDRADVYGRIDLLPGDADAITLIFGHFDGFEEVAAPVLIDADGDRLPGIERQDNLAVPGQNKLDLRESRLAAIWTHDFTDRFTSELKLAYWEGRTDWTVGRPSDWNTMSTVISRSSSDRLFDEDSLYSELKFSYDFDLSDDIDGTITVGGSYEDLSWDTDFNNIWSDPANPGLGIPLDLATRIEPPRSTWIYGPETRRTTDENDASYYASVHMSLYDKIELQGGLRHDFFDREQKNRTTLSESDVSDDQVSPSVGAAYHLLDTDARKLTAYANWGKGFSPIYRAVANTEIVELEPETSESWEVGLKGSLFKGRVQGSIAYYDIERKDVVFYNAAIANMDNVGNWDVNGLELGLSCVPVTGLTVYSTLTTRDSEIAKDDATPANEGNDIPLVADFMATLGAEYRHECGFGGGIEYRYVDDSYGNEANSFKIPDYHLVDAHLSYDFEKMTVSLFSRNLFDEEYYSGVFGGVRNGSAFEGTPRTIGLCISSNFGGDGKDKS